MKKIPESYELNEDDIKEAITDWLNNQDDDGGMDFEIELNVEHTGPDNAIAHLVSAKATKL